MTLTEVKKVVKDIKKAAHDDEVAHTLEDDLYLRIIKHHAANGCELSKEALKASRVKFGRWTS
jgi:hypothetical protein